MLVINILLIILLTSFYTIPLLEHKLSADYEVFKPGRMERTDSLIQNKIKPIQLIYTAPYNFCFEIGLVSIIGLVLTILAHKKIEKSAKKFYWFALISGIVCVIMSLNFFPFEKMPAILKMLQFTFRLLEFSSFFFAALAGINYSLVIKNFKLRDILIICFVTILLLRPAYNNCVGFGKQWSEDKLWPAVEVNENTGRVHAGCATFEYLPSKAYENLDYIKTRENRVYVLSGSATIENEEKNGTKMTFNVSNIEENTTLELPYIYYLGYNIQIEQNGQILTLETFESSNGFVAVNLPNTEIGKITVKYTGTTIMQISYIVSIITFISIVVCLIVVKIKSKLKN